MTFAGVLFMSLSWGIIVAVNVFCLARLLKSARQG